jgi:hypothetical protein
MIAFDRLSGTPFRRARRAAFFFVRARFAVLHFLVKPLTLYYNEQRYLRQTYITDRILRLYGRPMFRDNAHVYRFREEAATPLADDGGLSSRVFGIEGGALL